MVTLEPESLGSSVSLDGRDIVFFRSFRSRSQLPPRWPPSSPRTLICVTPFAAELTGDNRDDGDAFRTTTSDDDATVSDGGGEERETNLCMAERKEPKLELPAEGESSSLFGFDQSREIRRLDEPPGELLLLLLLFTAVTVTAESSCGWKEILVRDTCFEAEGDVGEAAEDQDGEVLPQLKLWESRRTWPRMGIGFSKRTVGSDGGKLPLLLLSSIAAVSQLARSVGLDFRCLFPSSDAGKDRRLADFNEVCLSSCSLRVFWPSPTDSNLRGSSISGCTSSSISKEVAEPSSVNTMQDAAKIGEAT
jgi:hypothetical protein